MIAKSQHISQSSLPRTSQTRGQVLRPSFLPFALLLFLFVLPLASALDARSVQDPNIDVRLGGGGDAAYSFFSIATRDASGSYVGSFSPGDQVNFRVDVTSYNVMCKQTYVVAEVYNAQDSFVKASSKWIGEIKGGNNYFVADIPYQLSTSESSFGEWRGAGYLWCDESNSVISKAYSTSFSVAAKGASCTEGYQGPPTCRSGMTTSSGNNEDAYRLFLKADCSTEYRRVDQCVSGEVCSAGACSGVQAPGSCGDNKCLGEEDQLNCAKDCTPASGGGDAAIPDNGSTPAPEKAGFFTFFLNLIMQNLIVSVILGIIIVVLFVRLKK